MTGSQLTARQEECLRLVAAGYSTDEMARLLGLSSHTINKYVEDALRKLDGVGRGRRAVAREFVKLHPAPPEQLVSEAIGVERMPVNEVEPPSVDGSHAAEVAETAADEVSPRRGFLRHLPIRRKGERWIDLTTPEILIWVPVLALVISVLLSLVLTNLETAQRLQREGALGSLGSFGHTHGKAGK